MNWKRKLLLGVFFATCSIWVAGCSQKEEVIWYISNPDFYGVERGSLEPYGEVKSERFDLFNERLEELGISVKVIFKYLPTEYVDSEKKVANLLENDSDADIVGFAPLEYKRFLILDDYLGREENQKVLEALPDSIWKVNRINGETYQIPKGNVAIHETVYSFYTPFLEQYQITLKEEEIKEMDPREVIEFLLPYFEEERLLDDQYYLTSGEDLRYMWYYLDKFQSVITNVTNSNISVDLEQKKIVNLLETSEMKEALAVSDWIYKENIDAHIEREQRQISGESIFQIESFPSIEELSGEPSKTRTYIPLGNRFVTRSQGNGVLNASKEKELAVQVLAASMYDEELTNLMIYGIPEKDYQLLDGHAVYLTEKSLSSMGTFSSIGNNLIAYPNQIEVKEKREITEKLLEETPMLPYSNFVPLFEEDTLEKMTQISEIYFETESAVDRGVADLETYLNEQRLRLEEEGVNEVILTLQEQLDDWRE